MKLSRFIEILQEDINQDLEVACGISIEPESNRIWFPESKKEKENDSEI